jgi:hypothetical protein
VALVRQREPRVGLCSDAEDALGEPTVRHEASVAPALSGTAG